jgi:hypothetical protein
MVRIFDAATAQPASVTLDNRATNLRTTELYDVTQNMP